MIITINTKEDGREDIRKAIEFLQQFVQENHSSASEITMPQQGLFDLFGSSNTSSEEQKKDSTYLEEMPKKSDDKEEKKHNFQDLEVY